MADALKIELKLLGVDKTIADMKRVASEMQQLHGGSGSGSRGGSLASLHSGGGSGGGGYASQRQDSVTMRGFDKIASEIKQAQKSMGGGGGKSLAQMGAEKAEGAEASEAAAGLAEMAGPLAVAVVGIKLLADAAKQSADILTRNQDAYYIGGGTPREMAQGASVGAMAGMNSKEFAQAAMDYSRAISPGSGSPFARVDAQRIGNQDSANPYAAADDKLTNYLRAIEHVTSGSISDKEARREARNNPSLQPYLGMRGLPEARRKELMSPGGEMERMFSPESRRAAAEYNLTIAQIGQAWESFVVEVGRPIMGVISDIGQAFRPVIDSGREFFHALEPYGPLFKLLSPAAAMLHWEVLLLTNVFDYGAAALKMFTPAFRDTMKAFEDMGSGNFKGAWKDLERLPDDFRQGTKDADDYLNNRKKKYQDAKDEQQTAVNAHTKAMQDHTMALNNAGIYGGGDRTRGAVPGAYSGNYNVPQADKNLRAIAHSMGAFAL